MNIDGHKIHYHPRRVADWNDAETMGDWEQAKDLYPIYVEVSPVGACNHRCTFCAVDYIGYKNVQMDGRVMRDMLREMGRIGVKSVMFAGEGEPLLHKEINSAVIAAVGDGLDVAFTTNGVLLNKLEALDLCEWVKVSMNAGTEDTYRRIHKAHEKDWGRVWENLAAAVKRKGKCKIGVQMVMLPENSREAEELYARACEVGVDYVVLKPYSQHKSSLTRQYEDYRPMILPMERPYGATKLLVRDDAPSHEAPRYTKCHATPNFWAYVMATGDVYSCSAYLLDERFKLGNVNQQTFKEIWEGDRRRANWEFVRTKLDITECRRNCRMHKVNEYLWDLQNGVEHENFI